MPEQYAMEACRYQREIGSIDFAAVQDWMCEPVILTKTGLSVREHQERTIESYLTLRGLAPDVPWLPVPQDWEHDDYLRLVAMYQRAGIALDRLPRVGLRSVCRRQHTEMVEGLIRELAQGYGLRLHGFGLKTRGLSRTRPFLASADSMAWSMRARFAEPLPQCRSQHQHCTSCPLFALSWRAKLITTAHDSYPTP